MRNNYFSKFAKQSARLLACAALTAVLAPALQAQRIWTDASGFTPTTTITYATTNNNMSETPENQQEILRAWQTRQFPASLKPAKAGAEATEGLQFGIDVAKNVAYVVKYQGTAADVMIPDDVDFNGKSYPVVGLYTQSFVAAQCTSITFGKNMKEIMPQTFTMCMKLTTINFNEGFETIGNNAFYLMCNSFKSITFPSTLKTIGDEAFAGAKLTGEITLPASLETIGAGAFKGNPITGFYFEDDTNKYFSSKEGVLYSKDGTRLVCFPPGLVEQNMTLPEGLKAIDAAAFFGNTVLKEITFPASLEEIGPKAFANCGLTTFTVSANVRKIGEGVVYNNKSLTSFVVDSANKHFKAEGNYLVNTTDKELVAATYFTGDFVVPEGVESVLGWIGYQNKGLTSFKAPASVKKIGNYAFDSCTGMTSIEFPGLVEVGDYSFQKINLVTELPLPATLKKIGITAFAYMNGLVEVVVPNSVEEIGRAAFFQCTGLKKITFPGIKKFGDSMCYQCTALEEAVLGEGFEELPEGIFNQCSKLAKVNIPSTVKYLRLAALYGCPVTELPLPAGLRVIGNSSLYGTSIKHVVIPDSVVEIGNFAFTLCNNTETVKCGKGLKKIGDFGFQVMRGLKTLELNEGLDSICFKALQSIGTVGNDSTIHEITIPSTVTFLGDSLLLKNDIKVLTNLAKTPQPLTTIITGDPYLGDKSWQIYDTMVLRVPESSLEAYKSAEIWKLYEHIEGFKDEDGIDDILAGNSEVSVVAIYSLDGKRLSGLSKGINICKMSDGSVRKVMKK